MVSWRFFPLDRKNHRRGTYRNIIAFLQPRTVLISPSWCKLALGEKISFGAQTEVALPPVSRFKDAPKNHSDNRCCQRHFVINLSNLPSSLTLTQNSPPPLCWATSTFFFFEAFPHFRDGWQQQYLLPNPISPIPPALFLHRARELPRLLRYLL
jgi:hypothetical protein